MSTLFDLYLVSVCLFSCTPLFVSISQVICCKDRLRNDLAYIVSGGALNSTHSLTHSLTSRLSDITASCFNLVLGQLSVQLIPCCPAHIVLFIFYCIAIFFMILYTVLHRHVTLAFYGLHGHLLVQTMPWYPG